MSLNAQNWFVIRKVAESTMEVESGGRQLVELTTLELASENPEDGTDPNYALQFIDGKCCFPLAMNTTVLMNAQVVNIELTLACL